MKREFHNDSVFADGLFMISCGIEKCERPFFFSSENNDAYRIYGISEGKGEFEADGKVFKAEKGDCFVFRPGVKIRYSSRNAEDLWTYGWIFFGGSDAEFYLSETGLSGPAAQKRADTAGFSSALERCLDLCERERGAASQIEINAFLLQALCALIKPRASSKVRQRAAIQTEKALRFIESNYMRGITARDVTAELNIDRTHFFRIFKAKTGYSPEQYIMRMRIRKAKELLETGTNTVTEIASLVGVNDVYYFSKLFKRAEGISPTEYRKKTITEN